jgi:hypothetical protein
VSAQCDAQSQGHGVLSHVSTRERRKKKIHHD